MDVVCAGEVADAALDSVAGADTPCARKKVTFAENLNAGTASFPLGLKFCA